MNPVYNYIISGVFVALLGLVFWVLKYQLSCQRDDIKTLQEKTEKQELKIQHLEGLLWSEDKLTKVIKETVKATMNEILVAWYEKGKMGK